MTTVHEEIDEHVEVLLEVIAVIQAVEGLPDDILNRLAEGPWPEPHCGVCRALEKVPGFYNAPEDFDDVMLLVDWHDAPLRRRRGHYDREGNYECYLRCQAIYTSARLALKRRQDG